MYLIFKRSATSFSTFTQARKYKIQVVTTIELARQLCSEYNDNRTSSQIRRGTKYEFTSDF
jgi:type III secretory pathway component EscU